MEQRDQCSQFKYRLSVDASAVKVQGSRYLVADGNGELFVRLKWRKAETVTSCLSEQRSQKASQWRGDEAMLKFF